MKSGRIKKVTRFLGEIFQPWMDSKAPRFGAALAFYTIFAVAPLFVIALAIAGFCFGEEAARRELFGQLNGLVGREGGEAIQTLISAANQPKAGTLATVAAIAALCAGATGVFIEIQDALNIIWGVERKAGRGLRNFVRDRLLSFAMVVGIGFLLLVSLVLSALLAAVGKFASDFMPEEKLFWEIVNFVISFGVITLLFAMIFKILPDVRLAWRDVWVGAGLTALLFNLGKFLIGFYLGRSTVSSIYGAAGSLMILLLWAYYSAQILYFGASFTRVYAGKSGARWQPSEGARFVVAASRGTRKHLSQEH